MEEQEREDHREQYAQLVHRHDYRRRAVLERLVEAEPGGAGSQTGEHQERAVPPADRAYLPLRALHEHDGPGHDQDDDGAYRRAEVGLDALYADLPEDRRQRREHRGEHRVDEPGAAATTVGGHVLPLDHHHGAHEHQHHPGAGQRGEGLSEEHERQEHGEDGAALVNRRDLVHVAQLDRPEVAEPGRARRQPGKDQEGQRLPVDVADGVPGAGHQHHQPRHDQDHDRAYGRGQVRVDVAYADLREYGRQGGEHRGQQGEQQPGLHGRSPIRGPAGGYFLGPEVRALW